jgi:dTDP-glucose pyrophosphorylase/CBS domain-containing protein
MRDPTGFLISPTASIRETMALLDVGAKGIVLLADEQQRLLATVTDGDIRRAILAGLSLDAPVTQIIDRKPADRRVPLTMPAGSAEEELLAVMQSRGIRHLPVVDEDGRVVDLALREDLEPLADMPVAAVIMAGGFGTRLRPLTDNIPKPMLPIGGTPLLERTVDRLRQCGIRNVNFTTHYLPEVIEKHFGDGSGFGVNINYVPEDRPLGTAGALSLLPETAEPLLVMNGDILTSVDFQELLQFHQDHAAAMTVCVRQYEFTVPYGVIQAEHGMVRGLREKPKLDFLVNAGIYLLEPVVRNYIPAGRRFDMTDLIDQLLEHGLRVASFPVVEYWLDIGQIEDFQRAQQDVQGQRWAA